ncbi:MAG: NADH-quinone oxidoreductase subunit M, partial [Chromatiales bacterium]
LGIGLRLGLDGLSLILSLLAALLGLMAVAASWREVRRRAGFFYLNLLWTLTGVLGVFLARDLFLFFLSWELMLVPMVFLIRFWGHAGRQRAAFKFLMFTQTSGLLLLAGVLLLVLGQAGPDQALSFRFPDGPVSGLEPGVAWWAGLCLFLAFTIKLPMVPLHTWLPDAHSEAPTGASVLLAGLLLKTGAYGLLRLLLPLLPEVSANLAPVAVWLGVASILYGALLAFAQTDLKRLVACSSISHMGFVLLGVFSWNLSALRGVVVQLVAHGISAAALFMLSGALLERLQTRNMACMGGLWGAMPRLAGLGLLFALANLGLPGLGNFVGEFLILFGSFSVHPAAAATALLGLLFSAAYALALVQRVFHGPAGDLGGLRDVGRRETLTLGLLALLILALGLYPQALLQGLSPALHGLGADQVLSMLAPGGQP